MHIVNLINGERHSPKPGVRQSKVVFHSFLIFIVVILLMADLKLSDFQRTNEISGNLSATGQSQAQNSLNTNRDSV